LDKSLTCGAREAGLSKIRMLLLVLFGRLSPCIHLPVFGKGPRSALFQQQVCRFEKRTG